MNWCWLKGHYPIGPHLVDHYVDNSGQKQNVYAYVCKNCGTELLFDRIKGWVKYGRT